MIRMFLFLLAVLLLPFSYSQTIHVFVALCDNENQGIVPVPSHLGNGQDPTRNLYWGAAYGVQSYFQNKTQDWEYVTTLEPTKPYLLKRILFKHKVKEAYLLADAYDGAYIQTCIEEFLLASNGQHPEELSIEGMNIMVGGGANLIAYVGHNGLMEFNVEVSYKGIEKKKDLIILACSSQTYFSSEITKADAKPILWTTNLMAPEAYTLKAAIDGWLQQETGEQIKERSAQAYNTYQKCGIRGARNLFATGF